MENQKPEIKELLDAGVHFGHLTRRWNPNMAPYIYMERNGIHIINLYKTLAKLEETQEALKKIAASGRKIMFVATKKQAKEIVAKYATEANMPYITERWPGGMLTNFVTMRRSIKKMKSVDKMKQDGRFDSLSKKEKLQMNRMRDKLEKNLGSIADMNRLPGALFVVDTLKEHIAVSEANKLNIPVFALNDTNSNPRDIDFPIPANDDASKSIEVMLKHVFNGVKEGLEDREQMKADKKAEEEKRKAEQKEKKAQQEKKAQEEKEKIEAEKKQAKTEVEEKEKVKAEKEQAKTEVEEKKKIEAEKKHAEDEIEEKEKSSDTKKKAAKAKVEKKEEKTKAKENKAKAKETKEKS